MSSAHVLMVWVVLYALVVLVRVWYIKRLYRNVRDYTVACCAINRVLAKVTRKKLYDLPLDDNEVYQAITHLLIPEKDAIMFMVNSWSAEGLVVDKGMWGGMQDVIPFPVFLFQNKS